MGKMNRALISVTDKSGIVEFAEELVKLGMEIISTGGTANILRNQGIPVTDVSEVTGFPEILDGRVKTLHPKIHGGILGRRDVANHVDTMKKYGIKPIDIVVVNLYAFEKTVARKDCTLDEAIENIDIGGPTLLRAAAKNYKDVTVIVDPSDYATVIKELKDTGQTSTKTRFVLAKKVFKLTHEYDGAITRYLESVA
ncbi:MAG TPA: IMP cyclohydrolase [Syntrophaceae bacterium]|nr:IMP cyclohydrolase [Syntrophaceae bacterium]